MKASNIKSTAICVALLVHVAVPTHADTITVTNTNDSGPGSLRQALAIANDGDTITFAVTGTVGLTSGELLVDKSIIISGPGASALAVNGNAISRVFHIASSRTVTISGITITNGNASGNVPDGGGIYNDHAMLTVSNCTVSDNSVIFGSGGGIYNNGASGSATLQINNGTLSGNSAGAGAGVFNDGSDGGSASLEIAYSTLSGNLGGSSGGGILNYGYQGSASLTVVNSTLSGNSGFSVGGGIWNYGEAGHASAQIANSTLSGNSASGGDGGGIINDGQFSGSASLQIANSTLSSNTAFNGGGIFNAGQDGEATLTVGNSTLNGNSATTGGGMYNDQSVLHIRNTILNAGASGDNISNFVGTVISHGYNLSSDNGGGYLTGPGDQINTNAMLGSLRDNGGPTLTHRPYPGSPAIDAGDPNFTPPPFYDQRGPGFDRVVNGRIDKGSFEVQSGKPPVRTPPTLRPRPTPAPRPTPPR